MSKNEHFSVKFRRFEERSDKVEEEKHRNILWKQHNYEFVLKFLFSWDGIDDEPEPNLLCKTKLLIEVNGIENSQEILRKRRFKSMKMDHLQRHH